MPKLLSQFPLAHWLTNYPRSSFSSDLLAGIIVTVVLIPQGMAYALLAGMPAQYGLYAAIAPLFIYALLGSSRSLAVGPVAIASLMTGATLNQLHLTSEAAYINAAVHLSLLCAAVLLLMRLLRLGQLVSLLSQPVIAGFTSAAAIIIAISQLQHLLGVSVPRGLNIAEQLTQLWQLQHSSTPLLLGALSLALLWFSKAPLANLLHRTSLPGSIQNLLGKSGPIWVVIISTSISWLLYQETPASTLAIVGHIPSGLPDFGILSFDAELLQQLLMPAALIALIGFVESVSVGSTLAAKRQERVDPDQELLALGCANLAATLSHTFPVAGGFGRSMVNHSAGAQTPIASMVTAVLLALVVSSLTSLFFFLPKAALAAIIIMAVLPLIEIGHLRHYWRLNRTDAATMLATFTAVLALGTEVGLLAGILLSIGLLLRRTSRPHIAVVGRVGNSEHFRNEQRHHVSTSDGILMIRIDESLCFANANYVECYLLHEVQQRTDTENLVLVWTAVNYIDSSALDSLTRLNNKLQQQGIALYLAEVKGPVMDQLECSTLLDQLGGPVFFTSDEALRSLSKQATS